MYKPTLKSKKYHIRLNYAWSLLGRSLIDADGHIKKNKSSGKTTVHITMHKQQEVYVKKLLGLLSRVCENDVVGSVHVRSDNNSCVLNISPWVEANCATNG